MEKLSKKTAVAKFFRLDGESLPEISRQVKELTDADVAELAPACAAALGVELKEA